MIKQQPHPKSLGERLNLYRTRINMSRKELAELIGVTPSTIRNYENDITEPDINRLYVIADALGVTISMLMHGREPERETEPLIISGNPQI